MLRVTNFSGKLIAIYTKESACTRIIVAVKANITDRVAISLSAFFVFLVIIVSP